MEIRKKKILLLLKIKQNFEPVSIRLANKMAKAIKCWANSLNVQFFTHWFGSISKDEAEKYISMQTSSNNLQKIATLKASELFHTQVDSSSFVQSQTSQTHRACGYAVWNVASPVFIKEIGDIKILCIPSVFYSHDQESLDFKIPLIRSCKQLSTSATKLLHLLGYKKVQGVESSLGCEQEYFLIEEQLIKNRLDLSLCGQTLLGSSEKLYTTPQNNYYSPASPRRLDFMEEVANQCLERGILAKLQHGEVALKQYEVVCQHTNSIVAADQNVLLKNILQQQAQKHGYRVLLTEKPFDGVSGSGKHNNWSISTNTGINLIDFKQAPAIVFLTFFSAVMAAVDTHYPLLMAAVTSVENSFRLGGHEAPSTIFSVDIGEQLKAALDNFLITSKFKVQNVQSLTIFPCAVQINSNTSNRNRTSTFAYTGNKFEFRAVGASQNVKLINLILNTIVADQINDIIAQIKQHGEGCIIEIIKKKLSEHMRIVYNQNCYSQTWRNIAKDRKIIDYQNSPEIYQILTANQSVKLFKNNKIYSLNELEMVQIALQTNYYKNAINMANIFCHMLKTQVLPSLNNWLSDCLNKFHFAQASNLQVDILARQINQVKTKIDKLHNGYQQIKLSMRRIARQTGLKKKCNMCYKQLLPLLKCTRELYDSIEPQIPKNYLPFATYGDILLK